MFALPAISYDFVGPRKIIFGWGRRREIGALAKPLGRRAFCIAGSERLAENGTIAQIADSLSAEGLGFLLVETLRHEPEVADVDRVAETMRQANAGPGDLVLGIGGGAAMDLAKAVAALAVQADAASVKDYLENVGRDLKIQQTPLPIIAMPTTAGTGAEATRNAVISSYDPAFKKSFRDERIMPQIALIDPEMTVSVPPSVTAASGMDAITQCIESFISRKAKPIPQALAKQGLELAMVAILEAVQKPDSRPAREAMSHAALLSGLALANSGLGMAHGVAAALGVHARVPHGLACAVMLPIALRVNRDLCRATFAELSTEGPIEETIQTLCEELAIPTRLRALGVRAEQIPAIVRDSRGSSMSGNPKELSDTELTRILEDML